MPRKQTFSKKNRSPQVKGKEKTSQLRIISGEWGSRKISFNAWDGLRPSPDRVRETLFNWINYEVENRHCLDLFAGTGILGIESLSRGASSATFVDTATAACQQLKSNLSSLQNTETSRSKVIQTDVLHFLDGPADKIQPSKPNGFSLVFADPPFRLGMIEPITHLLESNGWLSEDAIIYLEYEADYQPKNIPENWEEIKQKKAGQVISALYRRVS